MLFCFVSISCFLVLSKLPPCGRLQPQVEGSLARISARKGVFRLVGGETGVCTSISLANLLPGFKHWGVVSSPPDEGEVTILVTTHFLGCLRADLGEAGEGLQEACGLQASRPHGVPVLTLMPCSTPACLRVLFSTWL